MIIRLLICLLGNSSLLLLLLCSNLPLLSKNSFKLFMGEIVFSGDRGPPPDRRLFCFVGDDKSSVNDFLRVSAINARAS